MASITNLVPSKEPVNYQAAVHLVIVGLVTLGWLKVDNSTVDGAATVVGVLLAGLATWQARRRVVPLANVPDPAAPAYLLPAPVQPPVVQLAGTPVPEPAVPTDAPAAGVVTNVTPGSIGDTETPAVPGD